LQTRDLKVEGGEEEGKNKKYREEKSEKRKKNDCSKKAR
jgi:hypothetical protein